MGGMRGFGAVDPSDDERFHAEWEKRVFAVCLVNSIHLSGNADTTRFRLEQLPPTDYLRSYFERWYLAQINACREANIINEEEKSALLSGQVPAQRNEAEFALTPEFMERLVSSGVPTVREESAAPAFGVGDEVRARNLNPATHTRLPGYVKGKIGQITALRGTHVFPDSNAKGDGEDPKPLYAVRFSCRELWGDESSDSVILDLWEPYLEML